VPDANGDSQCSWPTALALQSEGEGCGMPIIGLVCLVHDFKATADRGPPWRDLFRTVDQTVLSIHLAACATTTVCENSACFHACCEVTKECRVCCTSPRRAKWFTRARSEPSQLCAQSDHGCVTLGRVPGQCGLSSSCHPRLSHGNVLQVCASTRGLHTGIHTKNFSCTHACILCAHARVDTSEFEDNAKTPLVHLRSRRAQTRLNKRAPVVSSHADHRSKQRCHCGPHPAHGFKQKHQESVCLPTRAQ
jgi:hypothetical protein